MHGHDPYRKWRGYTRACWLTLLKPAAPAGGQAVAAARARDWRTHSGSDFGPAAMAAVAMSDARMMESQMERGATFRRVSRAQVQETSFLRKTSFCMLTCCLVCMRIVSDRSTLYESLHRGI